MSSRRSRDSKFERLGEGGVCEPHATSTIRGGLQRALAEDSETSICLASSKHLPSSVAIPIERFETETAPCCMVLLRLPFWYFLVSFTILEVATTWFQY